MLYVALCITYKANQLPQNKKKTPQTVELESIRNLVAVNLWSTASLKTRQVMFTSENAVVYVAECVRISTSFVLDILKIYYRAYHLN